MPQSKETEKMQQAVQTAKITSKGQITLPLRIRKALGLREGDRVAFVERDGKYELANSNEMAFQKVRDAFDGEAEKLGINTIDDVVAIIKQMRQEGR
jgi:AbrB family looped-hinge helix DNA binding protein